MTDFYGISLDHLLEGKEQERNILQFLTKELDLTPIEQLTIGVYLSLPPEGRTAFVKIAEQMVADKEAQAQQSETT